MSKLTLPKSLLTAAAVSLMTVAEWSIDVRAQPAKVDILVSPSGSGPYLAWATMQNYAENYTKKIQPTAVETPGFTYNVRFLASSPDLWENTIIGSGEVVEWAAINGVAPFFPQPLEAVKDFKVLGVMSRTTNLFVTMDPKITKKEDFSGRRVAVGLLTQNEWGMHQRMMLDHWGMTGKLKSFDALFTLEAGPFKKLESAGRPYTYVHIQDKEIQSYIDATGVPFSIQTLPANTISNQPKPVTSFGNFTLLSVHKSFPEELAYEMTKLWLTAGPQLGKYSAIAKIWDQETVATLARTTPERMHPGAMRAYKEAGLVN